MVVVVGAVLYDDFGLLNLFGVLEMLAVTNASKRSLLIETLGFGSVADDDASISFASGSEVRFPVDANVGDSRNKDFDVVFLPAGDGFDKAMEKASDDDIAALSELIRRAKSVIATGNAASVFDTNDIGLNSNGASFQVDNPEKLWIAKDGVSSEIDLVLRWISKNYGPGRAKRAAEITEYSWGNADNNDGDFKDERTNAHPSNFKIQNGPQIHVGFVLYDNFEMFDTFGPMHVFRAAEKFGARFKVDIITETQVTKSFRGPSIRSTQNWPTENGFDILFLPGGLGTVRECNNQPMIDWLHHAIEKSGKVMPVCSGSAIVATTGLLDGKKATTNKESFSVLEGYGSKVDWQPDARWVEDGKFFTSSGVSAGTDLALRVIELQFGSPLLAEQVANSMGYIWNKNKDNDPFAASPQILKDRIVAPALRRLVNLIYQLGFALKFDMNQMLDVY